MDSPATVDRGAARDPRLVVTTKTGFAQAVLAPGALRTLFQPIVRRGSAGCRVEAQECLTRGPAGTPYRDLATLFAAARHWGLEASVDRARVTTAFETVARGGIVADLFLLVRPATLMMDAGFPDFLATTAAGNGIDWTRLTVAVVEQQRECDAQALALAVRSLKALGIRMALDDYGVGAAELRPLERCPCGPDRVRIDATLVQAASRRSIARRRVEGIVTQARRQGIDVIAAGVDGDAPLRLTAQLGIELVQGLYLSGPLPAECAVRADLMIGDLALCA